MKAVILAGGLGTRLSEETLIKPKPMVEIGARPILWHIMKIYSYYGINDFIICCGYKGYIIKEYFSNYFMHQSDVTFKLAKNEVIYHEKRSEDWNVTLVDTGLDTMTGGRLKRVASYIESENSFCFTYGDGVSDLNIRDLIKFHESNNKIATMTATIPPGRFGAVDITDNKVKRFQEKPKGDGGYINGGFFVLSPKCLNYIESDNSVWEKEPLNNLAKDNELMAYTHDGFWSPMDTLREKEYLDDLVELDKAPWIKW